MSTYFDTRHSSIRYRRAVPVATCSGQRCNQCTQADYCFRIQLNPSQRRHAPATLRVAPCLPLATVSQCLFAWRHPKCHQRMMNWKRRPLQLSSRAVDCCPFVQYKHTKRKTCSVSLGHSHEHRDAHHERSCRLYGNVRCQSCQWRCNWCLCLSAAV